MTLATHSFRADDRGAMAPLMAVIFTLLAGFGALAIDVAHAYRIKTQLSSAADAGSLAGAQQLPDTTAAKSKGVALAAANAPSNFGTVTQAADVVVGYYDRSADTFTAGGSPTNAVKVTSARTAARGNAPPKFLIGALGLNALDVEASAVAYRPRNSPPYCVYVLNNGNSNGSFSVTGGGEFAVPNCGVYVNSAHPNGAAQATGASKVRASRFCVVGGVSGTFNPAATTGCAAIADPLSGVAEPAMPTGCKTPAQIASSSWSPGLYCGSITPPANVTMSAGTYYFYGATLNIGSGQNITGTGVTWFFDATSTLNHTSGGTLNISAPTTGSLAGIAMFQSRSASLNNQMKLSGNADFTIDGTIYFPRASLALTGSASVAVPKTGYVITWTMSYTGNSDFYVGTTGGTQALGSFGPPKLAN